jgi:uncharacterized protein
MGAVIVIDLRRLSQAPMEVEGEIASDDSLWSEAGVELIEPLAVEAIAEGSPTRGVWVRGSMSGHVRTSCRRCLQPLELPITEDFELLFDPKTSEGEGDLTLYGFDPKAEELDLRAPLSERFLLVVPGFSVCREDCPGLCGHCGASLSQGGCGCGAPEPDPRWGPLQALKRET